MQAKCPYCAEIIQAEAVLCKHCNQKLTPMAAVPPEPVPLKKVTTITTTETRGIL